MEKLKQIKTWIFHNSPGYEKHIDEKRSYTSKMIYTRSRIGFTRLWAPGSHIEGEYSIFHKRFKPRMFHHFKYFGPRGEIAFYAFFCLALCRLFKNNLARESSIESLLNDRNVYFKLDLPSHLRTIS